MTFIPNQATHESMHVINRINWKSIVFCDPLKGQPSPLSAPPYHRTYSQQQYRRITKRNVIRTSPLPLKSCFFKIPPKPPKFKDFPIFYLPKSTSQFCTRPSLHLHFSSDTLTTEYHQYRTTTTSPLLDSHLQHAIDGLSLSIQPFPRMQKQILPFNQLF